MTLLEERMRALLRWYPRAWRERHGDVMLATLLDDAEARGIDEPTRADAWSIRVHGAAERATPALAALAAGIGLLLSVGSMAAQSAGVLFDARALPGDGGYAWGEAWQIALIVATTGIGMPFVAIAMIALARVRLGTQPGSTVAAAAAVLVAGGVLATDAVRTVLLPVADSSGLVTVTGVPQPPAVLAAVLLAGIGLLPFVHDLVLRPAQPVARWAVAFVGAGALASVGVALTLTGLGWVVAFTVLVLALSADIRSRPEVAMAPRSEWSPAAVATLSGAAILLGLPSTLAIAITSTMSGLLRDDGLWRLVALAIVGSLLLLVALATVGRAWFGPIAWFAGGAFVAASIATIVAVLLGIERASGSLTLTIAGVVAGLGVACTLLPIAPGGGPVLRAGIAIVLGATAAAFATQALPFVFALAWLGGVPLLVVAIGRLRRARVRRRALGSASG